DLNEHRAVDGDRQDRAAVVIKVLADHVDAAGHLPIPDIAHPRSLASRHRWENQPMPNSASGSAPSTRAEPAHSPATHSPATHSPATRSSTTQPRVLSGIQPTGESFH